MINESEFIYPPSRPLNTAQALTQFEQASNLDSRRDGIQLYSPPESDTTSGPGSLPSGAAGDILYHDGTGWVALAAPIISVADPVLRHNGINPYWEEPESC